MAHSRCRKRQVIAGHVRVGCLHYCCINTDHSTERKVGCDRTLPTCLNCKKRQRTCQGYGLRLAWPDKQDGRRKQKRYEVKEQGIVTNYLPRKDGQLIFLNTFVKDLDGSKLSVPHLIQDESISILSGVPMPLSLCSVNEQDGILLNHCRVSQLILDRVLDPDFA